MPQLVVTVHGLNSDGEWQQDVQSVLEPHFRCVGYRYRTYRYFGFALQFFGPICTLLAVACIGALWALHPAGQGLIDGNIALPGEAWAEASGLAAATYTAIVGYWLPGALGVLFIGWSIRQAREDVEPLRPSTPPTRLRKAEAGICCLAGAALLWLVLIGPLGTGPSEMRVLPALCVLLICLCLAELLWAWYWPLAFCALGAVCVVVGMFWPASNWRLLPLAVVVPLSALSIADLCANRGLVTKLLKTWLFPLALLGLGAWIGMWMGIMLTGAVPFWLVAFAAVLMVILSVFEAISRRGAQVADLTRWLRTTLERHRSETESGDELVVHAIAHSFGTFLTGSVLERQARKDDASPALKLARVLLVGSVLRTRYPWGHFVGSAPVFDQIRNEVGGRDWVVRLAGVIEHWRPLAVLGMRWRLLAGMGFGDSGRCGFKGDINIVHDVSNSLDYCEICRIREERQQRRVHNLLLPTFYHSDVFHVRDRCKRFWLPFLLGLDPWQFWDFHLLCTQAAGYQREFERFIKVLEQRKSAAIDKAIDVRLAGTNERADQERKLVEAEAENAKVIAHLQLLKERRESVLRQLGERVWDWACRDDLQRETFQQYVAGELARRRFRVTPDLLNKQETVDEVLAWASEATPRVIQAICGNVEAGNAVVDSRLAGTVAEQPLTDSDRRNLLYFNPREATAEAVSAA